MSSVPSSLLPPVGWVYGAIYLALILTAIFYGIMSVQTFFYFAHYPDDQSRTKSFVAILWVLCTIHAALGFSGIYKILLNGAVNPLAFMVWCPELVIPVTTMVSIPAQGFFVYRIYIFNNRNIVVPLLWFSAAIFEIVTAILYAVKLVYIADGLKIVYLLGHSERILVVLVTLSLSISAGVDILLSLYLTYLLLRRRCATHFASTANVLRILIAFAVNTGAWTAAFSLLTLVLLHALPKTLYYAVPGIPICQIYCNTLLANLNARTYIGRRQRATNIVDTGSFTFSISHAGDRQHTTGDSMLVAPAHQDIQVWKTTEVAIYADPS